MLSRRIAIQWRLHSEHPRFLLNLLIFELGFLIAYRYAMNVNLRAGAPFWLPDSVLLCALLLSPPRTWLVYLAATLPLRLAVAVPPNTPMWFLLAAFANDSLKAIVAAALLRRYLPRRVIRFDRLHDFWIYLAVAVVLAPALSGLAGAASWVALGREFWPAWRDWFFGDALANLVLTPLLLCLALGWRKFIKAGSMRYLEAFVLLSGVFFATQFAYRKGLNNPGVLDFHYYVPMVFLLWAAVRLGPAGSSASLAIMSLLSITAAAANRPVSTLDDTALVLSMQLFLIVIGVPILSLSVLIEQHQKTEHSLRESEERFRNIADTAPVMIVVADARQKATFFNKAWTTFTGRTLEQETDSGWTQGVHPSDLENCLTSISCAYAELKECHLQYRLRRADGEYRLLICNGVPRFERDRTFIGFIASCIDITDLKHAQEEALARQKLESLGVLAGGIAHDFNNLLGGILASSELALAERTDGFSVDEELKRIKTASIRGAEIVRELMIYGGEESPILELVDISAMVNEMLQLLKVSISKHTILKVELSQDLPPALANPAQIRQVVMNLVTNASEAIGERPGEIRVTSGKVKVGPDSPAPGGVDLAAGDYLRLEVFDTGGGMTPEVQARIFDPFFTTKRAGRGLGLAAVQGIIRGHGGTINVESAAGLWSRFVILLPSIDEAAQDPRDIPAISSIHETGSVAGTVLVVEDEEILRVAVSKKLRREGFLVIDAADGILGVSLFRANEQNIDAVLLDVTLPGMSGRAVLEELRRMHPDVKVILTSAYGEVDVRASIGEQHPPYGYIRKPYQLSELTSLLRNACLASK